MGFFHGLTYYEYICIMLSVTKEGNLSKNKFETGLCFAVTLVLEDLV